MNRSPITYCFSIRTSDYGEHPNFSLELVSARQKFEVSHPNFWVSTQELISEEARLLAGKKQTNTQATNNSRKTLNLGCMRLILYLTMRSRSRWEAVMIITGTCLAKVPTFKAGIYLKLIDDTTYLSLVLSSVSFKSCYFRLNRTMKILHFTIQVVRLN